LSYRPLCVGEQDNQPPHGGFQETERSRMFSQVRRSSDFTISRRKSWVLRWRLCRLHHTLTMWSLPVSEAVLHRQFAVRHGGEAKGNATPCRVGRAGDHVPWNPSLDHLNSTTLWCHRTQVRPTPLPTRPPSRPRPILPLKPPFSPTESAC